jgi:murein L,D-transpeptidase YafK
MPEAVGASRVVHVAPRFAPGVTEPTTPLLAPLSFVPTVAPLTLSSPSWASGVRTPTDWMGDRSAGGNRRAALAREHKANEVSAMFAKAGVGFPPEEVFFRAFKDEAVLEVWATGDDGTEFKPIATYGICAASGKLGPKRREGDLQVPEGFYKIEYFWPDSAFHIAAKVSYPNTLDRALNPKDPGGQIMIHGSCASIGCLAMTDERIEELFLIGTSVTTRGGQVQTHIFPSRDFDTLLADDAYAEHHAFWRNLRPGYDAFERDRTLPRVVVGHRGRYEFPDAPETRSAKHPAR